ncbi:hypothetical protein PRIC2_001290 [Phytophthora ramorum]
MPEAGTCSCTLQARLHQVENARSREMTAHGELVQQLERELESRHISEAEIRLAAAKLRTENCRLEAELSVVNAKARQLLEQLDALRTESTKREGEFKTAINENERRFQAARDKNDQLLEEIRQLNVELSECRNQFENALSEKKLLLAKNEELCLTASSRIAETEKLSTALVSKQQEIEASAVRSQVLIDEQNLMHGRLQEVEREINRTLVTRDRALHWRRKRNEIRDNQFLSYGVFLTWKSVSVQARLSSAAKMAQCNEHNRGRLQLVEQEVLKRCSQAKENLQGFRQACAGERMRIQLLRDEICQANNMTLDVDGVGTKGGTVNGTSGGGSTHPPLFDSPSKYGIHHTIATYIPTEQRFRWQGGAGATDALYTLPTSTGAGPKKSFGNSTREDWDFARKRADPGAGPGSYEPAMSCGMQVSSECRSSGSAAFENAPRAPVQENTTASPGPIYDLPPVMGRGSTAPKQGTSLRPPLNGKSIGPGPNLMLKGSFRECRSLVSPTFGTELRLRSPGSQQTPGPIYDLRPTGYLTGPRPSFSHAKRF